MPGLLAFVGGGSGFDRDKSGSYTFMRFTYTITDVS